MSEQLVVKNADGKEETINVIDIVLDNETGKKYIFYTIEGAEEIYAAILVEKGDKYIIQAIEDDEEFALVDEILRNKVNLEGDNDE